MKTDLFRCSLLVIAGLFWIITVSGSNQNDTIVNQPVDTLKAVVLYQIIRVNGMEYIGELLNDDGREVLLLTQKLGKIYIPKSEIQSMVKIDDVKNVISSEYITAGPFTTRYTFTTNALPLRKGLNYAGLNLYGPEVHFALANNFSLGIMTSWIGSPFIFVGKWCLPSKKNVNYSLGTLLGTSGYFYNFDGYFGLHYANITIGTAASNFTLAGGYIYAGSFGNTGHSDMLDFRGPMFSLAGILKVGQKASVIFDSMLGLFQDEFGPQTTLLLMPGMRFQTSDDTAFQVSIAGLSAQPDKDRLFSFTIPIPMCTWFYRL